MMLLSVVCNSKNINIYMGGKRKISGNSCLFLHSENGCYPYTITFFSSRKNNNEQGKKILSQIIN